MATRKKAAAPPVEPERFLIAMERIAASMERMAHAANASNTAEVLRNKQVDELLQQLMPAIISVIRGPYEARPSEQ